tara:strand:- start:3453 stop:4190 length:738 start_codon:yes stop_codon:yes gene_type:complete
MKDTLFLEPIFSDGKFCFNQDVVSVFDDMVSRSVPYYKSLHGVIVDIITRYFLNQHHIILYDVGCSTGNFLKHLVTCQDAISFSIDYYGLDYSLDMLSKTQSINVCDTNVRLKTIHCNLNESFQFNCMNVCLFNLVLQFLDPGIRLPLLKQSYNSLAQGGLCFVVEKVSCDHELTQSLFTSQYHDFKQSNGYTKEEIKNKDRSLNNVLVPFTVEDNCQLLKRAGFKIIQPFFQWFNFVGILAIKD